MKTTQTNDTEFTEARDQRPEGKPDGPWTVLLADGEQAFHQRLAQRAEGVRVDGRRLRFIHCFSAKEARNIFAARRDLALALINRTLEAETAGVNLTSHVRDDLQNPYTRIVLFSNGGDPAREAAQALHAEINDFRPRQALRGYELSVVLHGQLRAYRDILRLKNYRDRYIRIANADGLTGIANRRHFDRALEQEWRRAQRQHRELALVMIDIDFFKNYNDLYGHLEGDDALKKVATALHQAMRRPGDLAARFGGEEFACLLAETSLHGACRVARDLHQAVADLQLPHEDSTADANLSISLGVAALKPDPGKKPADLIRQADAALYRAKECGRNRIEPADDCRA